MSMPEQGKPQQDLQETQQELVQIEKRIKKVDKQVLRTMVVGALGMLSSEFFHEPTNKIVFFSSAGVMLLGLARGISGINLHEKAGKVEKQIMELQGPYHGRS